MFRDRTVIRLVLTSGSFGSSGLAHVQPGDGAADDQALDLGGALEDGEDLGVPVPPLDRVVPVSYTHLTLPTTPYV